MQEVLDRRLQNGVNTRFSLRNSVRRGKLMLRVSRNRHDFVAHDKGLCPVKNAETGELFEGWIWTETDPSIPFREGAVRQS